MNNIRFMEIAPDEKHELRMDAQSHFGTFEVKDDATLWQKVNKLAHSTFDKSKFTLVGSPNITDDGILSNCSNSNHLSIPNSMFSSVDWTKPWTLRWSGTLQKIGTDARCFGWSISNTHSFINIGHFNTTNNFFFNVVVNNNGTPTFTANKYITIDNNTEPNYDGFLRFTGTKYIMGIKLAGASSYTTTEVENSNPLMPENYNLTVGFGLSTGSMNLRNLSLTVDGVPVFSGNKTGIDTIKPDAYTTTTTPPTISNDGIASNFTSSNFIKVPKEILNNVGTNSWSIKIRGQLNNYANAAKQLFSAGGAWNDVNTFLNVGHLNNIFNWFNVVTVDNSGTKERVPLLDTSTNNGYNVVPDTNIGNWFSYELNFNSTTHTYSSRLAFDSGSVFTSSVTNNNYLAQQTNDLYIGYNYGDYSINLNTLKIHVAGNLVFQGCLKIPYTEGKNYVKVVDKLYRDRVKDLFEQKGYNGYYTIGEDDFTLPSNKWSDVIEHKENGLTVAEQRVDQTLTVRGACEQGVDVNLPMEFFSADSYAVFGVGTTGTNTASKFTPAADGNYIAIGKGKV